MRDKIFALLISVFSITTASAQTYTNQYPKELNKIAQKWMKKGEWKNGFTKALPDDHVNAVEFYLQYHRNPQEWDAVFKWMEETDLLAVEKGRHPIPGTDLTVNVEDGDNWCSEDDLKAGKGSESHCKKIDFMLVVRGSEGFALLDHDTSTQNNEYTLDRDRKEYKFDYNRLERFYNTPGRFIIMFPCDWHCAKIKASTPQPNLRVLVCKVNYKQ